MFFYSTDSRCIENVNPVEVRCFYQTLAPEWLHPDEVSQENICLGTLFLALLRESGLEATKATNPEQVLVFLGIDLKCRHFQKKKKKNYRIHATFLPCVHFCGLSFLVLY